MVWSHVHEHALTPELSLAACSGGQVMVSLVLGMKIDKNMRNDLLEQAWPSLLPLEVQWKMLSRETKVFHRNTTAQSCWEAPAVEILRLS